MKRAGNRRNLLGVVNAEQLVGGEWAEWYRLTPAKRWAESEKLWPAYLMLGGSLDPEPDTQSPFFDPDAPVRALLMGGQACVWYGAAEFSRDADLAILAEPANLARLRRALAELQAEVVAVPAFRIDYLRRGHAIHFRCHHPEASRLRVDVMSRMRGLDAFAELWARRTSLRMPDGFSCDLMIGALPLATLEGAGQFRQELEQLARRRKCSLKIELGLSSFPLVARAMQTRGFDPDAPGPRPADGRPGVRVFHPRRVETSTLYQVEHEVLPTYTRLGDVSGTVSRSIRRPDISPARIGAPTCSRPCELGLPKAGCKPALQPVGILCAV